MTDAQRPLPQWPPCPRPPRAGDALAETIASEVNLSWEASGAVLGVIVLCLRDAVSAGQRVNLHGFGTLCVRDAGQAVHVTFRPHRHLRTQVQGHLERAS